MIVAWRDGEGTRKDLWQISNLNDSRHKSSPNRQTQSVAETDARFGRIEDREGNLMAFDDAVHKKLMGESEPFDEALKAIGESISDRFTDLTWQVTEIKQRLSALEPRPEGKQEAVTESEETVRLRQSVQTGNLGCWTVKQLVDDLLAKADGKNMLKAEAIRLELERRLAEAAKPVPEPTSELFIRQWKIVSGEATICQESGWVYSPATPAQIRAEAVRLGLLDTPRQKVESNLLSTLLYFTANSHGEQSYGMAAAYLRNAMICAKKQNQFAVSNVLGLLAGLLEAAKGEG